MNNFDAQYSYVTNEGTVFTFRSNLDAPRYCLINIDIQKPDRQNWTTLIPQHDKDVLGETYWKFQYNIQSKSMTVMQYQFSTEYKQDV